MLYYPHYWPPFNLQPISCSNCRIKFLIGRPKWRKKIAHLFASYDFSRNCLNTAKFNHNFRDTINPLCSCSLEIESVSHNFLRCQFYNSLRHVLMDELSKIDETVRNLDESNLIYLLLYGNRTFYNSNTNTKILNNTISFIKKSGRFDNQLLWIQLHKDLIIITYLFNFFFLRLLL